MPLKARAGLVCGALVVIGAVGIYLWTQGAPRREALASLARLDSALHSGGRTGLLDLLVLPAGQRSADIPVRIGGTPPAQADQIVRAPAAFRLLPADL